MLARSVPTCPWAPRARWRGKSPVPSLSYSGRLAFASGAVLTAGGVLGAVEPLMSAGAGVLLTLAWAWVQTVPLPRRLRRERLEFTWWAMPAAGSGVRRPDEPVRLRIALRNPSDEELTLSTPRLALSSGLRHARFRQHRVRVPAHGVASFELEVRPGHVGRHVMHGAWMTIAGPFGLAWAPLYFPNPLTLEVQPRGAAGLRAARGGPTANTGARSGRSVKRAGEGPEVRELRELRPGDPFRRIAWKASARKGKLLVRETDDEAQTTRVLLIDSSATMRGDDRGSAKIDYAIEMAAQGAKLSLHGGDALGIVGFDARVVTHVAAGFGPAHMRAVLDAAVQLRSVVDEDLTDVDEETLVRTVARYFREQEGVDALRGEHPYQARVRIAEMCSAALASDPSAKIPVRARDSSSRALRQYCRARAIALPLRHDPSGAAKTQGLAAALKLATEKARGPRTILVVSDCDPLSDVGALRSVLAAARQRRHRVTVVAPSGADFLKRAPGDGELDPTRARREQSERHGAAVTDAVRELFVQDERARLHELRGALARIGVPLYLARAQDPAARWWQRAAAGSRAVKTR